MKRVALVFVVMGLAVGCTAPPPAPTLEVLAESRWIDLSHAYDADTIFWPTGKPFEHIETAWGPTENGYFYSSFDFFVSEHAGTHLDAPIHFAEGRRTADQIPLEELAGPAVVIDVTRQAAEASDYRVSVEDLTAFEADHGMIPAGSVVLIRTDWSRRWPDVKSYLGDDTPGRADNLHFPGIGVDAAELLVERAVAVAGIDTAGIDHGPSRTFDTHQVLLGAEIPALENLTNLDQLPARGAWVIAMPMKIGNGSGGPCRVAGLVLRGS